MGSSQEQENRIVESGKPENTGGEKCH